MKTVGAFEAKTHFSQLLVDVSKGKTIGITKHGEMVAMLVPASNQTMLKKHPATEAIKKIKVLRKGITLGSNLTIKALKEIGRK